MVAAAWLATWRGPDDRCAASHAPAVAAPARSSSAAARMRSWASGEADSRSVSPGSATLSTPLLRAEAIGHTLPGEGGQQGPTPPAGTPGGDPHGVSRQREALCAGQNRAYNRGRGLSVPVSVVPSPRGGAGRDRRSYQCVSSTTSPHGFTAVAGRPPATGVSEVTSYQLPATRCGPPGQVRP